MLLHGSVNLPGTIQTAGAMQERVRATQVDIVGCVAARWSGRSLATAASRC